MRLATTCLAVLTTAAALSAQCGTGSLATLSSGNTSFGAGGGNYFDVNVTNPYGLLVCQIDTQSTAGNGTPITVEIYETPGSYVGLHQNPAPWRLVATGTGTGVGSLQPPVPVTLAAPFFLAPGSHGMFVRIATGGGPQYFSGANTFSNADLTITTGGSQATPFSSALATPRTWCGVLRYSTCMNGGEAGYGLFGLGCAGSMPVSTLQHGNRPVLGQSLAVTIDNLPLSVAIMVIGFSRTSSGLGPLPFDLGLLGAPGCMARVSMDAFVTVVGSGNTAGFTLPIPNLPTLQCLRFYNQALVLDPGFNALGVVASDAHAGVIGT